MLKIPALASKADLPSIFALMGRVNERLLEVDGKVHEPRTLEFVTPEMAGNEKIGLYEGTLNFRLVSNSDLPSGDLASLADYFVKTE